MRFEHVMTHIGGFRKYIGSFATIIGGFAAYIGAFTTFIGASIINSKNEKSQPPPKP